MNCEKCGFLIYKSAVSPVVCPHCHTLNTGNGPPPPAKRLKRKLMIAGVTTSLLAAAVVGFLFFQNYQALVALSQAGNSINRYKYEDAARIITKADKDYFVFGATRKKLSLAKTKDEAWLTASQNYQKAFALVGQEKLAEAKATLALIPVDFPSYGEVESLKAAIKNTEVAAAAAKANPSAATSETYQLLSQPDLSVLKIYGALFIDGWSKYPTDWVANSKLKGIAFAKNLAVGGTLRAAAPDPIPGNVL